MTVKLEARRWLVEAMNEVAIGIRIKLGPMHNDWEHACSLKVGISSLCSNNHKALLL
jgi:hypothetical protein